MSSPPVFNLGFRPFYLLAASFAALGIPLWLAQYFGVIAAPTAAMAWHAHEMVYGFAIAVIVGFLFTAVRNWTGLPTPSGGRLAALCALWIGGRIAMLRAPGPIGAAIEAAFLPVVAIVLWQPLARTKNRNRFFVGILLLLAAANIAFHLARLGTPLGTPNQYVKLALYLVVFIVAIMAGRVTPSFTKNAIPQARVRMRPWLDRIALTMLALTFVVYATGAAPRLAGGLAILAALAHLARVAGWDPWSTRGRPILWILHLSYLWIPVGLVLLACAAFGTVPEVLALHAFGAGAVGGMVIGMITRTARGHSGLPLQVGKAEVLAYVLVHLAALLRVLPALIAPSMYALGLGVSGLLWSLAFAAYLWRYAPVLMQPRLDGKPG